jgi:sugar-specific transcriptional regulator TrmB
MQTTSIESLLQEIGLSKDQTAVYIYLVRNSVMPANILSRRLNITRTLVYKVLDDLIVRGLVTKDESFKIARYSATHPYSLRSIADQERQTADTLARKIEEVIAPLVSEFNVEAHKPAVHFMEGLGGLRTALEDTLTASEPVRMFVDTTALEQDVLDIDAEFVKKRLKLKKTKYILTPDSSEARMYQNQGSDALTHIKLLPAAYCESFSAVTYLYDKKVVYLTFTKNAFTTTTIYDEQIYLMQRSLFESLWHIVPPEQTVPVPLPHT